jgi:hypothetical protein
MRNFAFGNEALGNVYDLVNEHARLQGLQHNLTPQNPIYTIRDWGHVRRMHREAEALQKAMNVRILKAIEDAEQEQKRAESQDAVVNPFLETMGFYDDAKGVMQKTDITFSKLRYLSTACEPADAIISKRVSQVVAFGQVAKMRFGRAESPGFRVKLTVDGEEVSARDKKNIKELEQFLLETGFTDPPEHERPVNWQPGFDNFLGQLTRDSMTLDWACMRRWRSADAPDALPVVAFCMVDAAKIRRVRMPFLGVKDGRAVYGKWEGDRIRPTGPIQLVRVSSGEQGGSIMEEYAAHEMASMVRNVRTDDESNGYGLGELERCMDAINIWIFARDYNSGRFRNDALPRGLLSILANMTQPQMDAFKLMWRQQLEGVDNRWRIPFMRATPQQGSAVTFTPFDMSSRDQEYHQFMFAVALWMHSKFGIHPEETGFEALSPFKPPLSEASPETKLKYSQDSGLTPILRKVENFINRELMWKLDPSRRFSFTFEGVGEYDEAAAADTALKNLQAGLITPRMLWASRDQEIPEKVKDADCWDFPMPWADGMQLSQTLAQSAQQAQQQADMQRQQQEQGQQQMDLQKMQTGNQMAGSTPTGPDGQPMEQDGPGPQPPTEYGGEAPGGSSSTAPKPKVANIAKAISTLGEAARLIRAERFEPLRAIYNVRSRPMIESDDDEAEQGQYII